MHDPIAFPDGDFAFLKGVFPYSQGVVALPGFAIERARFARPLPVAEGFRRIAEHLAALGRPKTAFCACELRSPKPFSFAGFGDFNQGYIAVLEEWGLYRDRLNPVARSNVAPEIDPPAAPSFYAFSYTVPAADAAPRFVVAGSGEWPEGGRFPEDIVARGDATVAGLRTKTRWVLAMMAQRMRGLGVSPADVTVSQVYTVRDFHPLMPEVVRATPNASLTWHYCRPPIEGLDYEMDLRAVSLERVLAA
ncbi:MAG: hypothetical protein EPO27_17845 [Betaproteobacteria bacterium]|nr:MAG: hypothetical protein EPO27_17845 [Betaproteobacteria bacterium]